jgi:hypothetical protein
LLSTIIGRVVRVLDPAFEDEVDTVRGDYRVGYDQGLGKLPDAEVANSLDACPYDLGRHANGQQVAQEHGDCTSSRVVVVVCNAVYTIFI